MAQTSKTTNEYGVTVSLEEDFSRWNWDGGSAERRRISIAAAKLVMLEIHKSATAEIDFEEETSSLVVWINIFGFDAETKLTVPLLRLVDEWIELYDHSGGLDDHGVATASAMADQLEEAAARLRREID